MLFKNAFVVDVEEWFHICGVDINKIAGNPEDLEVRVIENTKKIISLLKEYKSGASFFFVGWIAERYPDLVKLVANEGFEIGCHSYSHRLIYEMSPEEFRQDLIRATEIIERNSGIRPAGYRAPGFSIKKNMDWYFEILGEMGYKYDASVFPTMRAHGGIITAPSVPHIIDTRYGKLIEFPQSVIGISRLKICFSGGGYFRLLPYWFIKKSITSLNKKNIPVLVYIHPREIDPLQPRMKLNRYTYFKYYVNLEKTERKLRRILSDFSFTTVSEVLRDYFNQGSLSI